MAYHKHLGKLPMPEWYKSNFEFYNMLDDFRLEDFFIELNARFDLIQGTNLFKFLNNKEGSFTDFFKNNNIELSANKFNSFYKEPWVSNKKQRHISPHELFILKKQECKETLPAINLLTYQDLWEYNQWLKYNLNNNQEFYSSITKDEKKLIDLKKSLVRPLFDNSKSTIEKLNSDIGYKIAINEKINLLIGKNTNDYFEKTVYDINCNELNFNNKGLMDFNIDAPKDILISNFTKLISKLKNVRSETLKQQNSISKERLDKWIKYKVLNYFDLLIYFNTTKQDYKITSAFMGEFLFPDDGHEVHNINNPEKTINDHVKKHVNHVFSLNCWTHLYNQFYTASN